MEQQNKRSVIVGAFVFIALVIFVLGVMTLGGQKSLFNNGATVNVVFNESRRANASCIALTNNKRSLFGFGKACL